MSLQEKKDVFSKMSGIATKNAHKKRIAWVDIAKGIAISAIIIGHFDIFFSSLIPWAHDQLELMYSFHVAAFFILSGYTMSRGPMRPKSILKLFRCTMLPYLITSIVIIGVCWVFSPDMRDMDGWLKAFIYGAGGYRGELVFDWNIAYVIGAIWFLPALFFGKVIASFLTRMHIVLRVVVAGTLFVIGDASASYLFLPMDIQQALCASWYLTCGYIMKETKMFETSGWEKSIICLCATIGIGYMWLLGTGQAQEPLYCTSTYHNGIIDMFGTVCASMVIMFISQLIAQFSGWFKRGVEWIGKNSLPMFCWHAVLLAPHSVYSPYFAYFIEHGVPAELVFILALAIGFIFSIVMTALSMKVPILNQTFFPYRSKRTSDKNSPKKPKRRSTNNDKKHIDISPSSASR